MLRALVMICLLGWQLFLACLRLSLLDSLSASAYAAYLVYHVWKGTFTFAAKRPILTLPR